MELSIKQISEGGTFMVDFKKVVVERCHYINAVDERVEDTEILLNSTASIMRVSNNGTIFIQIFNNEFGSEFPLAQFRITSAFYHKDGENEISQTSLVRGNEIIEELPVSHNGFEDGNISMFMISKQQGKIIAFMIVNPKDIDDYYYRIMFEE
jgi:hypothetical protein